MARPGSPHMVEAGSGHCFLPVLSSAERDGNCGTLGTLPGYFVATGSFHGFWLNAKGGVLVLHPTGRTAAHHQIRSYLQGTSVNIGPLLGLRG